MDYAVEIDCEDDYQNLIQDFSSEHMLILGAMQKHSVFAALDRLEE